MALVFISHSSDDNIKARDIFETLKSNQIDYVFLDFDLSDGIKAGEEWEKRLYLEIKRSHLMLLLLSSAWIDSKWCFAEYQQAKALGKEIIPINIENSGDLKVEEWISNHIQHSDYIKNPNIMTQIVQRIKDISMDTQRGFLWDKNRLVYPGFVSFDEADAAIFFGRDEEIRDVVEKLTVMQNQKSAKFLNIVAASGLGKSSLLKAGILARLKLVYKGRWKIFPTMRPMQKPLYEFSKLVARVLGKEHEYRTIYSKLKSKNYKEFLDDIITDIELISQERLTFLLPIDQAEEFYTIANKEEKALFFKIISYLFQTKESFFVIWTLRSDYLNLFQMDPLAEEIHKHETVFSLSPLRKEQVRAIIKNPSVVAGIEIEEQLVDKLKEDMKTTDALPLLALTLHDMYVRYGHLGILTMHHYHDLAQDDQNLLEKIVHKKAEEAIGKFKNNQKYMQILKNLFVTQLIRINESRDGYIRKPARWDDISVLAHEMIESLVNVRLLIKSSQDGTNTIEIAHEALMRTWRLLQGWLEEEREFLLGKVHLEMMVDIWDTADEEHKKGALLNESQLQKVLQWKEKLCVQKEIEFINQSLLYHNSIKRRRRNFIVGAFVAVSSFSFFSSWEWYRANEEEQKATYKSMLLKKEINKSRHNIGLFFVEKAKIYIYKKFRSKAHLFAYYALEYLDFELDQSDAVSTVVGILECYPYIRTTFIGTKHTSGVQSVLITKDQKSVISTSDDNFIFWWDIKSGKVEKIFKGHTKKVLFAILNNDESMLISCSMDQKIIIWDVKSAKVMKVLYGHTDRVYKVLLTSDEQYIISCSWDGTIRIWNLKNGKTEHLFTKHSDAIEDIVLSKDEKYLYSASYDGCIGIWSMETKSFIRFLKGHLGRVFRVILKDDVRLFSSSEDKTIRTWDLKTYKTVSILKGHEDKVYDICLLHTKDYLISSSYDRTICSWDLKTNEIDIVIGKFSESCNRMAISQDDTKLFTAVWDTTLRFWDMSSLKENRIFSGHKKEIYVVKFLDNGATFLTGGRDKTIRLWDRNRKEVLKVFIGHTGSVYCFSVFSKGDIFISSSNDKTIRLWNKESGECIKILKGHTKSIKKIALTSDDRYLVSASIDKTIRIWDMYTYKTKHILMGHTQGVYQVTISSDNKTIVSSSYDTTIKLWDMHAGRLKKTLTGHKESVYFVVFSHDNHYLFSCSRDRMIIQWDISSGKIVKIFKGHTHRIYWLTLTPNGESLASCSRDNTIRIWDIKSGKTKHILKGHKKRVYSIDITSDGKTLVSVSWDKSIRLWDISTGKLLQVFKEYKNANILSKKEKVIKLSNGNILDQKEIKNKIKDIEQQLQAKRKGIDLVPAKQPYQKPHWTT